MSKALTFSGQLANYLAAREAYGSLTWMDNPSDWEATRQRLASAATLLDLFITVKVHPVTGRSGGPRDLSQGTSGGV